MGNGQEAIYRLQTRYTHPTHSVVIYGGVFMCTSCGATAKNKLVKLHAPCFPVKPPSKCANLRAYLAGRAPAGFPNWPYPKLTFCQYTVLGRFRNDLCKLVVAQREQQQQQSEDEWPDSDDQCPSLPKLSDSGSSSSQS